VDTLNAFGQAGIPTQCMRAEIMQRVQVVSAERDTQADIYCDMAVVDPNHVYAGNFGQANTPNCGVGMNISFPSPSGFLRTVRRARPSGRG
jgi:hypothetical protein